MSENFLIALSNFNGEANLLACNNCVEKEVYFSKGEKSSLEFNCKIINPSSVEKGNVLSPSSIEKAIPTAFGAYHPMSLQVKLSFH